MTSPIQRIQKGAIALGVIVVTSVIAFKVFAGYSWTEAIWMVVITISTVGYSEKSSVDTITQVIMVGVILIGVTASFYTFSGVLQLVMQGEIDDALGRRRHKREISRMKDHVIVCGFGRLGQDLVNHLNHRGIDCVVIEKVAERMDGFGGTLPPVEIGDAFSENTLMKVGIDRAKAIVAGLPTDADNIFITLTARNLNPDIQVISKCDLHESRNKFRQAGVNRIVMPFQVGAQQMERMISRPSTADLFELVAEVGETELDLDEFLVNGNESGLNTALEDSSIESQYGVIVIGIKNHEGKFQFRPSFHQPVVDGDILVLLGGSQQIADFKRAHSTPS